MSPKKSKLQAATLAAALSTPSASAKKLSPEPGKREEAAIKANASSMKHLDPVMTKSDSDLPYAYGGSVAAISMIVLAYLGYHVAPDEYNKYLNSTLHGWPWSLIFGKEDIVEAHPYHDRAPPSFWQTALVFGVIPSMIIATLFSAIFLLFCRARWFAKAMIQIMVFAMPLATLVLGLRLLFIHLELGLLIFLAGCVLLKTACTNASSPAYKRSLRSPFITYLGTTPLLTPFFAFFAANLVIGLWWALWLPAQVKFKEFIKDPTTNSTRGGAVGEASADLLIVISLAWGQELARVAGASVTSVVCYANLSGGHHARLPMGSLVRGVIILTVIRETITTVEIVTSWITKVKLAIQVWSGYLALQRYYQDHPEHKWWLDFLFFTFHYFLWTLLGLAFLGDLNLSNLRFYLTEVVEVYAFCFALWFAYIVSFGLLPICVGYLARCCFDNFCCCLKGCADCLESFGRCLRGTLKFIFFSTVTSCLLVLSLVNYPISSATILLTLTVAGLIHAILCFKSERPEASWCCGFVVYAFEKLVDFPRYFFFQWPYDVLRWFEARRDSYSDYTFLYAALWQVPISEAVEHASSSKPNTLSQSLSPAAVANLLTRLGKWLGVALCASGAYYLHQLVDIWILAHPKVFFEFSPPSTPPLAPPAPPPPMDHLEQLQHKVKSISSLLSFVDGELEQLSSSLPIDTFRQNVLGWLAWVSDPSAEGEKEREIELGIVLVSAYVGYVVVGNFLSSIECTQKVLILCLVEKSGASEEAKQLTQALAEERKEVEVEEAEAAKATKQKEAKVPSAGKDGPKSMV